MLTYAIGDIHGCSRLLSILLDAVFVRQSSEQNKLVFLGDYIDRGSDSAGVIAMLRDLERSNPDQITCLSGNHEDMLVRARSSRESFRLWIENGGRAALDSYGVINVSDLPAGDVAWMAALPTLYEDTQRYFVHAGLRPGKLVNREDRGTHLWIRDEFLKRDRNFGKHVVHGHTPRASGFPELRRYRTNLDTAAVYGGALTAGIFTDDQGPPIGLLQVHANGRIREIPLP